ACSLPSFGNALPGKKGEDRPRCAGFVAEVKVVSAGIVKIDCLFNQSQSEYLCVEGQVPFCFACDGRDVVKSLDIVVHNSTPSWREMCVGKVTTGLPPWIVNLV